MLTAYITFFIAMLVVSNPVGNVGLFLKIVEGKSTKIAFRIVFNMMLISCLMMLVILIAGSNILSFLGISIDALSIAGSIIVLQIGYKMVMGNQPDITTANTATSQSQMPSFMPLSFPLLCGPGTIALIILHSAVPDIDALVIKSIICIATACITGIVYGIAIKAEKYLSDAVISVFIRVGGLLLLCIGTQMLISAAKTFFMM